MMQAEMKMMQNHANKKNSQQQAANSQQPGRASRLANQAASQPARPRTSKAPGPLAQGSECVTVAKNKPRGLEQPTAVDGTRATGTRLRVCNRRQKHAQGPRATNRRREGFGRVRADLGVAKVWNCYKKQ